MSATSNVINSEDQHSRTTLIFHNLWFHGEFMRSVQCLILLDCRRTVMRARAWRPLFHACVMAISHTVNKYLIVGGQ